MDPTLLQQFRQQLAAWIKTRLESQRLPFQRLEQCPETVTDQGYLTPDLVLWINRDSQLAGSMILLPDVIDAQTTAAGVSLAQALGLGHFTTWAPREVSIWLLTSGQPKLLHSFPLPTANRITPEDFQNTLDVLLERLKVITVTSSPPTASYSVHYFANLCLRNLQELTPSLTISARVTAGETAADAWVEHAPREKAWMSLWRMLFLLSQGRLPPGLQPERLELAIRYALTELAKGQLAWLDITDGEPPLPEEGAVRLHHLASRLRQLGWPQNNMHAQELIVLLLEESARRLGMKDPLLPWTINEVTLFVACQPPRTAKSCSLVAPRAYLAGWIFKAALEGQHGKSSYAESLQLLDTEPHWARAIAALDQTQPLDRKQRDDRLIWFRQVWPSRRFDLPRNAPAWLWDAMYLAGLVSDELSLILPQGWHLAPGILCLWDILTERYQLTEIAEDESGLNLLHFMASTTSKYSVVQVYRANRVRAVPAELLAGQRPGTTQAWLRASEPVVDLLGHQRMTSPTQHWPEEPEILAWGLFLFLQTRLGRYLWDLCSGQAPLPEFKATTEAVLNYGLPVPNQSILSELSLIGSPDSQKSPDLELLEREFKRIFGEIPPLPESTFDSASEPPKIRRKSSVPTELIAGKIFQDGIPRFPEHYLMHIYRPVLVHYELCGPLEIVEEFFERISLRTIGQDHGIEVSGKNVAEALTLASYAIHGRISLPADESILDEMLQHYRSDLDRLWDNLVRECRRFEPHRQAASRLARKIWQQHGLPPWSPS